MDNPPQKKCVMVLDEALPVGLAVNAAAVLAVTLGHKVEGIVGTDVADGSADLHVGLVKIPIPVLKADAETIRDIRSRAGQVAGLLVVDLTDAAQTSKTYDEYTQRMATVSSEDLRYLGLALHGVKKTVNKLTGGLSLLR